MKMTKIFAVGAALVIGTAAFALDGRQVMQNAADVKEPEFTHALVTMELIEKSGAKDVRVVEEWGRSKNDLADVVMEFKSASAAPDIVGTRFMQKEQGAGKDDLKWIYLPSLKKVRPVAASEGSSSFMGTDATYDDMSTRDVDDDVHELLAETEAKNGFKNCAKVKSTPKDLKKSQYSYRIGWVDKDTWVPVYVEMYDKKGKLVKTLEVKSLKVINGYPTPLENVMTNVQTGHSTRLVMDEKKLVFDKPQNPKIFTEAFLANGAKAVK